MEFSLLLIATILPFIETVNGYPNQKNLRGFSAPGVQDLLCPPSSSIDPCLCWKNAQNETQLLCSGNLITQQSINKLFGNLRSTNAIPSQEWLFINRFDIYFTPLSSLDLSSISRTKFKYLLITDNPFLSYIVQPLEINLASIEAPYLTLISNNFTNPSFEIFFKYFIPSTLHDLSIGNNAIQGSSSDSGNTEFLPGLGACETLNLFSAPMNVISSLGEGQFRQNVRLQWLSLGFNNIQIGDGAFNFDEPPPPDMENVFLYLELNHGNLDDDSINNQRNGLLNFSRPLRINLQSNRFEYVSAGNFEKILRAHDNYIDLYDNPLICGSCKSKWLKDEADFFKDRVYNANCANDNGKTIFTSDLTDIC